MNAALPQQATQDTAAWENPMGTDGFEFIEFAAPDPQAMGKVFEGMGFRPVARHRHKNVLLYRQGEINFIINAEPDSFAQRFARLHGPSVCAIAFRVHDTKAAYERALGLGAWGYAGVAGPGELNIPAIKGVIKRKLVMAIGDARLLADGKEIYVANDLRVGLFKREGDDKDAA